MNSMVLISEEVRGVLLGRRASSGGDREVRASSRRSGFSEAQVRDSALGNGVGEVRVSLVAEIVNQDEMERQMVSFSCDSPELEGSDTSDDWRTWMHGFEIGDMVWGKVKSHPWWPGHVFNEAFASTLVRKTKREGHVLVAFFGDSSYGWFEPAELMPFDSHFEEKSKQTTSRNFLKAVEEAVDEVSRRRALGLSCRCRDPFSFRPTSLPGYVEVDVIGYEPNLVYSLKEIKKARDAFVPVEIVSCLGHLALSPSEVEHGTIGFIKAMSTLVALRKATFEEFDETYAQAFGVEPVRPSRDAQGVTEQPPNIAPRGAPLSGPLVVAEVLGKKKGGFSKSLVKASKDQARKNKYLFKRRDDAPPPKQQPISAAPSVGSPMPSTAASLSHASQGEGSVHFVDFTQGQGSDDGLLLPQAVSAADFSHTVATSSLEVDNYVLRKRAPPEPLKHEPISKEGVGVVAGSESGSPQDGTASGSDHVGLKSGDGEIELKPRDEVIPDPAKAELVGSGEEDRKILKKEGECKVSIEDDEEKKTERASSAVALPVERGSVDEDKASVAPTPADLEAHPRKFRDATVPGIVVQKLKKPRRPDVGTVPHDAVEKKKKKRKKSDTEEAARGGDQPVLKQAKSSDDAETKKKLSGKSTGAGQSFAAAQSALAGLHIDRTTDSFPVISLPKIELSAQDLDFPLLVTDLSALALDPFHGMERNASLMVRHVFLRFRSLVYQKSLVPPPVNESDAEIPTGKVEMAAVPQISASTSSHGEARGQQQPVSALKPLKQLSKGIPRHDEPLKSRRKRLLSDRQEELTVKREKKLKQLKVLTSEKKTGVTQKVASDAQKVDGHKDNNAKVAPGMISKTDKKPEPAQPKVPSPTYLVMKFPAGTTLPSIASQKVKFGRFGPLDVSGFRVYWKSHTCKMLFRYRRDAQNAYMYASNNDMFGQIKVNYSLRDFEIPLPESVETDKQPVEARADDVQSISGRNDESAINSRLSALRNQQQQSVQLKSCLKKPSGDEPGTSGSSIVKESPRVKFMLQVEEGRSEPAVVAGNGIAIPSIPPADSNYQIPRPVNPLPPSSHPLPRPSGMLPVPQFPMPLAQHIAASHRPQFPPPPPPPIAVSHDGGLLQSGRAQLHQEQPQPGRENRNIDISVNLLNLLLKCHDLVNNVSSVLGYAIYHPL